MNLIKRIYPFIIISIVNTLILSPYLLGYIGITPNVGTNDNVDLQVPFRQVLQESIKEGRVPLWEPRISAGFPLLAEGQVGTFYPLNTLFALLPVTPFYSVSLSLYAALIISSIGMYLFLQEFLSSKTEKEEAVRIFSLFGAVIWGQTGVHFNHTAHLNVLNIFSLLPLELLIVERRLNNKDSIPKTIILLSSLIALQLLAGHPQFSSYCFMFTALYWLCNQIIMKSAAYLKDLMVNGLTIGFAIILGIGLGAIQLLPTLEFTANSTRQTGLDEDAINFLSLRIQDLPTFIAPFYNFTYEPRSLAQLAQVGWPFDERYSYIGIIPLILACISLAFISKRRQTIIFTILGTFFLLLSLGNQSPIGILLKLPPLNLFRIPVKFTPFAQLSFTILAAYALDKIINIVIIRKEKTTPNKKIAIILAILITITSIDTATKFYKLYPLQKGEWWFERPETVELYNKEMDANQINKSNKPYDAQVLGQDYNVQMHKQYLEQDPKLWDQLQPQLFKNNRAILPAFDMLTYDIPLLDNAINSAGLKVKWYSDLEAKLFFYRPQSSEHPEYPDQYWKLAQLVGAKYLIHNDNLVSDNTILLGKTSFKTGQDQVALYKVKNTLPFIQAPPNIKYVKGIKTLSEIDSENFQPDLQLIIPDQFKQKFKISENSKISNVQYAAPDYETVSIMLDTSGPTVILVRQSYFPGWTAKINNTVTEVFRANHAFQGIYIPTAGSQKIELMYRPTSFTVGIVVSAISLIIYLSCMITDVIMHRRTHNASTI